ncbi:MAG: DUF134 domain-containing protein [Firmicutes bacterium]|nr:DUF134 domain-containing protein [Bacillota bacterium]
MPRPKKCRKVCSLPGTTRFLPAGRRKAGIIKLSVEEYETIRLIDNEGFSQDQCSEKMHISRTTVQAIYACARKKIANALVSGMIISIEGGDYELCDGNEEFCGCGGCMKHSCGAME